jgi:gliding motility-associated lipoprotein GldD
MGKAVLIFTIAALFSVCACNSDYVPRPKGYFRVDFPEKAYRLFDEPGFPYTFEFPVYAIVKKDTSFFDFPRFNGRIYISYNIIGGKTTFKVKKREGVYVDSVGTNTFDRLVKGSYELTYKHTYKASSINDSVFRTPNGVEGIYFRIGGNTATSNQFLLTDSARHFLRGALYFDATPNEDSLSIVNSFLQQDMEHLINTLKWR